MEKTVYVVHCIDTEGPLYESPEVPFNQIKSVLGIDIEASEKNLIKLQNGLLDLNGQEKAVKDLIDVHKMAINIDWDMLRKSLETITTDEFRNQLKDSNGHGWVYSWFCMDHVGFTGENPRRRDAGYHHIFDKYMEMVEKQDKGDIVQFHHHPVSHSGNYHECGTAFWGRSTLNDILTRRIIDRSWFPTAFRPGFHTERPDSHWFLEQWIPFDYGNQAIKENETNQLDMMNGRFGDWRKAPIEWRPYHPSHDDYQKKGNCHRWITRCLNMYARIREISQEDVLEAFKTAQKNGKAILAFTDYDYKDMKYDIERIRHFLKKAIVEYPKVKFEYTDAITAMRKCCNIPSKDLEMNCKIDYDNKIRLQVLTKEKIFGPQPYLALKTFDNDYIWDNFDFEGENVWSYTFDCHSIEYSRIEKIGVAANNSFGKCKVMNYDTNQKQWKTTIWN